jgi:hypothetical protein
MRGARQPAPGVKFDGWLIRISAGTTAGTTIAVLPGHGEIGASRPEVHHLGRSICHVEHVTA